VKVDGYVEKMYVDFVGRPVRKGDPLFSLYSPSLLSAQNEYLLALNTKRALGEGGALASNGEDLAAAARRKLELWDVPKSEIERLERTREASRTLVFVSPISGVVTAKNLVEGSTLRPGDTPYEITDLNVVWVMADAYERDLSRLRVGQPATFTLQAYPGRVFQGHVEFIDPLLDRNTRTAKVHLHFENPVNALKPEMFGQVVLEGTAEEGLRMPADAVVHSGNRDIVFVALGEGKFQPREVKLGAKSGDRVQVLEGVKEGEDVVTRANFLVDSESQLRSALQSMGGK
jgi:Cu(I)/Ag(I) efflux system membrane fusion protein